MVVISRLERNHVTAGPLLTMSRWILSTYVSISTCSLHPSRSASGLDDHKRPAHVYKEQQNGSIYTHTGRFATLTK